MAKYWLTTGSESAQNSKEPGDKLGSVVDHLERRSDSSD